MKKLLAFVLLLAVGLGAPACQVAQIKTAVASEKPRSTTPAIDMADVIKVANGNTAFAADLYQALRGDQANLFYSPLSISIALAMTYAGARGETAEQMAETMHYDLAQPGLHAALNSLDLLLAGRGEGAKGKDGKGFRLNVVNAIWGQRDYHFETAYLDTIAVNYGAGVRLLDYVKEPDNSRKIINQWVSDQTEQRIKDLIPAGVIDNMTRLVLTNAVYFNAAWANPFAKEATRAGDFLCADGATVKKQMMSANESFGYASGDGWQLVELPYDRNELAMDIILPDEGGWTAFEDDLTAERLAGMLAEIQSQQVQLTMPKFEFENEFSLGRTLAAMGMPVAFTGDADFSGITGKRDLHIGEVIHKSFVAVDEAGTEAAAATAVVMRLTAMPAEPVVVNVDRPFVFLIRDLETGVVLFMGRVVQ
jgi:serpin B